MITRDDAAAALRRNARPDNTCSNRHYKEVRGTGDPSAQRIEQLFNGSWSAACRYAGLGVYEPRRRYRRVSKRECIAALRQCAREVDGPISYTVFDNWARGKAVPSAQTVRNVLGGENQRWSVAKRAANLTRR